MKNQKNFFWCSFCEAQIATNKANLIRHEKVHMAEIQKIKCSAENCSITFKQKSDYYRHWSQKHGNLIMPDGLSYVTSTNRTYKRKYPDSKVATDAFAHKSNDFLVLNYLGLVYGNGGIKLNRSYSHPDPFFGEIVFNE